MALNFPDSPSLNDSYTIDGKTWIWNGYGWKLQTNTVVTSLINSAFAQANTAYDHANAAFNAANNATDTYVRAHANAAFDAANTNATSITNLQGVDNTQNTSITVANNHAWSAFYHANAAFDASNTNTTSISNLEGVNTTQNTSISNLEGVNTTQNTNITTAQNTADSSFHHANAAFESANNAGSSVAVGDSPPSSPTANSLWWQSNTGTLKIYYSDGDSDQWVEAIAIPTTLVDQYARDTANSASGSSIALAIALG